MGILWENSKSESFLESKRDFIRVFLFEIGPLDKNLWLWPPWFWQFYSKVDVFLKNLTVLALCATMVSCSYNQEFVNFFIAIHS